VGDRRVWTNSVFGRTICTVFGIATLVIPFVVESGNGSGPWHGSNMPVDLGLALVGLVVTIAAWTSRLVLADGDLTATNFGIGRSIPLREVAEVEASAFPFLGMKIRRSDRSGVRTLVSGTSWDELWTPRAERIAREIEELAGCARAEAEAAGELPRGEVDIESGSARYLMGVAVVFVLGLLGVVVSLRVVTSTGWDGLSMLGFASGSLLMLLAAGGFWARDA
jgi:hypothetical protein